MITSGFGKFEKMHIDSFKYATCKLEDKVGNTFEVLINPESYTTKEKVEFCDTQAPGRSKPILKFNKMPAQEMNFDFLFDGTGVVAAGSAINIGIADPFAEPKTVSDQIADFKKHVFDYEGNIHKPYYLKIYWGTLLLKCVLTSIDIEYKLFNINGSPIRAIAKCGFKEIIDEHLLVRLEGKQSPDITHERLVKSGDRLSLMTHKIYNEQKFLLHVAAFNHLDSFRNIQDGTKVYFPPVEK